MPGLWEGNKDKTIVSVLLPGREDLKSKITLLQAIDDYKKEMSIEKTGRYKITYLSRLIDGHNNVLKKPITSILVGEILGIPLVGFRIIRFVSDCILFHFDPEAEAAERRKRTLAYGKKGGVVESSPETTSIQTASIDTLRELMLTKHLSAFQNSLRKSLESCPAKEYRIIPGTKEMIADKKHRAKTSAAINKMLSVFMPEWVSQWMNSDNVFIVVRESQMEAAIAKQKPAKKEKK